MKGFIKKLQHYLLVFCLIMISCSSCTDKAQEFTVGILIGVEDYTTTADGFIKGMEELGYVEGKDIIYDIQIAYSDKDEMQSICQDFVEKQVDLIVPITHGATLIAKEMTQASKTPIVFSYAVTNQDDLIESNTQPGGNLTGVRYPVPDMDIKRFELLMEINPKIQHILAIYLEGYPSALGVLDGLRPVFKQEGIALTELTIISLEDLETKLEAFESQGHNFDAIHILPEPITQSNEGWALVHAFASNNELLVAGSTPYMARTGAILSYDPDSFEMGELAAPIADKVLKNGMNPGIIPIVTPELHLVVNVSIAEELGLNIPDGILKMASQIIKD